MRGPCGPPLRPVSRPRVPCSSSWLNRLVCRGDARAGSGGMPRSARWSSPPATTRSIIAMSGRMAAWRSGGARFRRAAATSRTCGSGPSRGSFTVGLDGRTRVADDEPPCPWCGPRHTASIVESGGDAGQGRDVCPAKKRGSEYEASVPARDRVGAWASEDAPGRTAFAVVLVRSQGRTSHHRPWGPPAESCGRRRRRRAHAGGLSSSRRRPVIMEPRAHKHPRPVVSCPTPGPCETRP